MAAIRTVKEGRLGKRLLRLVDKNGHFTGLVDGKILVEGGDADDVWLALHREAGKSDSRYFGYSEARNRFLKFFPDGFGSEEYANQERNYKLGAKRKLDELAPLELAVDGTGFGDAILSVYRATNMLSPFEKTWVQELLRGPDSDSFIQATGLFTKEPSRKSLERMAAILKPHDCAKWTIATYLPYLWDPTRHMFLKPETTREFAARVGHPFAELYEAGLDFDVYMHLLDLASQTEREIGDLAPQDRIDIQSFIWVIGNYQDAP